MSDSDLDDFLRAFHRNSEAIAHTQGQLRKIEDEIEASRKTAAEAQRKADQAAVRLIVREELQKAHQPPLMHIDSDGKTTIIHCENCKGLSAALTVERTLRTSLDRQIAELLHEAQEAFATMAMVASSSSGSITKIQFDYNKAMKLHKAVVKLVEERSQQ